jgi:hypothetical protein
LGDRQEIKAELDYNEIMLRPVAVLEESQKGRKKFQSKLQVGLRVKTS